MLDAGFQGSRAGGLAFAKILAAKDPQNTQNAQNAKDAQHTDDATEARALRAPRRGDEACTEGQCTNRALR